MWGQVACECWSWLYKLCDIKRTPNLSEPQCLPLQQSRSASPCPGVVLVSKESMPRCASEETIPIGEVVTEASITVCSRKTCPVCDKR